MSLSPALSKGEGAKECIYILFSQLLFLLTLPGNCQ